MTKIKWSDVNKKLLRNSIFFIIIITLVISFIIKLIFGFTEKCALLDFLNTCILFVGFVIIVIYLLVYKKTFWHDWMFATIFAIIGVLLLISFSCIQPIIDECNKIEPSPEIEPPIFEDNIKGAIFLYPYNDSCQGITILVRNHNYGLIEEDIFIKIDLDSNIDLFEIKPSDNFNMTYNIDYHDNNKTITFSNRNNEFRLDSGDIITITGIMKVSYLHALNNTRFYFKSENITQFVHFDEDRYNELINKTHVVGNEIHNKIVKYEDNNLNDW